jgi:ABC-type phosphate transport system substrate-binding protein
MKRLILAGVMAAASCGLAVNGSAQVVIIANANMKVESISKDDVRDVFTGASTNLRFGPHARPVLMGKGKLNDEFMSTYLGMKEMEFRAGWVTLVFAGKMVMPPSFDSEGGVVEYVAHHPFTLGYIHAGTPHDGVKVLTGK